MEIQFSSKPEMASIKKKLQDKGKRIGDLLPVHKKVSVYLDGWVQKNFKTEGGNLKDGKWPRFKAGGRRVAGRLDSSAKLLQDTGALRSSHLPFYDKKNAGIGSNMKHAAPHNKGLGHLPMRRTIPKIAEISSSVLTIFDNHVKKQVKE